MLGLLAALSLTLAPTKPSFPYLGPGPLTNLGTWEEQAWTNAIAHVWFGVNCPLVGYFIGSQRGNAKKGALVGAVACTGLVVVRETFFHPNTGGPEGRTDLMTGVGSIWLTYGLMRLTW